MTESQDKNAIMKITRSLQLTSLLLALLMVTAAKAQDGKETRMSAIRQAYAQAKKKIDNNGKKGKSAKDMRIVVNQLEDEDVPLYDMTTLDFYFDESSQDGILVKKPYFIVENWSNHGHIRYSETLVNPTDQQVLFCYMRGETDAGFVVESRYYYDNKGKCIEAKHNTSNSWTTAESELEGAKTLLKVFDMVNYNGYFTPIDDHASKKATTPKTERMQHIRSAYAKAKEQIAQNQKADMPNELRITIHDQGDDMAPRTTETNIHFDKGCYFISDHSQSMSFDGYSEYLIDPQSEALIFSYTRSQEEGETFEWRYYYDENGTCIETKSNSEETDDGFYDKRKVKDLLAIYHALVEAE